MVGTLADPLLVLDEALTVRAANPAFLHAFGVGRDEVLGWNLLQLGQEAWNTPELRLLLGEVIPKAQAVVGHEVRLDVPQHGPRTLRLSARRLAHPDGNRTHLLMVLHDTTEAAGRASARTNILLAESQHRLKDLMAAVRARDQGQGRAALGWGLQGRAAGPPRRAGRRVGAGARRGRAATSTSGRCWSARWRRSWHDCGSRPGPAALLSHAQVLPLSLILHQLSTNAAKYGSSSSAKRVVELRWEVENQGEGQGDGGQGDQGKGARLVLGWREAGGPPVMPPGHSGSGTRLIALSAADDLGGTVGQRFEPTGLVARAQVPLVRGRAVTSSLPEPQDGPASLVLVVEDEVFVALDLAATLEGAGYRVLGPAPSAAMALKLLSQQRPDAAGLDVSLSDGMVTPVARLLRRMDVPFVVASAHSRAALPDDEVPTSAECLGSPRRPL